MLTDSEYKRQWATLSDILDSGDMAKFWREYSVYLLQTGVHSEARRILMQAAVKTAEELER